MSKRFEVAIIGSGIAGTLLAVVLARHGVRVAIVEKGTHPRFAVGESTVPETTFLLEVLARRYDVPELSHLRNHQAIRRHVTSACGIKRGFSFAYHHEGQPQRTEECTQFPTWGPPFGPDVHLFRQDTDAYILAVAVRYGATAYQGRDITTLDLDGNGARLVLNGGEELFADYVVDAAGHASLLARQLGLRQSPCAMKSRTRTLFTHMVNVPAYDTCGPSARERGLAYPFAEGTLHHLFAGGWFWVIPFDNHPSSTNPLCSVGLSLDLDRYPKPEGVSAEDEFWQFVRKFPSVQRHLGGARAAREWVGTGRLQYLCDRGLGERFFLMPHSMGFVDALFSAGLTQTASTVNGLGWRLIQAVREKDYRPERFAPVEALMKRGLAHHDRMVSTSYTAMSDFTLWNAWHRVWMLGSTFGATGHVEILSRYEIDGDPAHFQRFDQAPHRGTQSTDVPEFMALFRSASAEVDAFREGRQGADVAARRIFGHLEASGLCPPHWKLTDPERRCPTTFTLLPLARLAAWGYFGGPASVRKNFDLRGRVLPLFAALARDVRTEAGRSVGLVARLVKDALTS
jgi:FADH2 O2-dependent halogenase